MVVVIHGGLLPAGHGARQGCFVLIGVVVGRNGTLVGDGGGLCVVFHLDSVDCAARRVGGLPASGINLEGVKTERD